MGMGPCCSAFIKSREGGGCLVEIFRGFYAEMVVVKFHGPVSFQSGIEFVKDTTRISFAKENSEVQRVLLH